MMKIDTLSKVGKWKKMWWGRGSLSRSVASEERITKSPGKCAGLPLVRIRCIIVVLLSLGWDGCRLILRMEA